MIECQVRALFTEIASSEPGSSQVDTQLAHRRGRARLRRHRAFVAGAPFLAAAAVAVVALAVSAATPPRNTGPVSSGPGAPRQFSVLDPYLSFGWLPAGVSSLEGGTSRQQVWLTAGHKLDSPMTWSITVYAAGKCRIVGPVKRPGWPPARELRCSTPDQQGGGGILIAGRAPAVDGHRAYWAGTALAWQYAHNGWAEMSVPWIRRGSPGQPGFLQPANKREAIKIASHIQYGATTPPLLFPVQLTGLPSGWRVTSLTYEPDARVLRVRTYALGDGPPDLGADGGLQYQTGLPYFNISPATPRTSSCYAWPHRSTREVINGYRVVVSSQPEGTLVRQDLCAGNAHGLWLYISQFGAHPAMSLADLFGHHMRLLGRHPADWTKNPIG
jgi:hypothetical protein